MKATYIAVAGCHVCGKPLILRNIGYDITVNSEMTTPHPHLPRPVICQQCSMGPEATQQRVVRGGSAPPRPGPAPDPGEGYSPTDPLQPLYFLYVFIA